MGCKGNKPFSGPAVWICAPPLALSLYLPACCCSTSLSAGSHIQPGICCSFLWAASPGRQFPIYSTSQCCRQAAALVQRSGKLCFSFELSFNRLNLSYFDLKICVLEQFGADFAPGLLQGCQSLVLSLTSGTKPRP